MSAAEDPHTLAELSFRAGWTDGLPVVAPTRSLVARFVAASGRDGQDVIGQLRPLEGEATVEKLAANAVMAGCLPEYMPVVIAAIEAMTEDRFNLGGVQCSTHMATPLVIIHGPIRHELEINCGGNVFGQGWRANATIGRAVKLALVNVGGARPGETDKSTFGHPGKYTYCIGENEEASPWEPLHVERGLEPDDSAVTVFACEAPHNVNNQMANDPFTLLETVASSMATLGANGVYVHGEAFVALGPEHAEVCARAGWKKDDVRQYLFEHARVAHRRIQLGGIYAEATNKYNTFPRWVDRDDPDAPVPITRRVGDIALLVVGGPGKHSVYLPGWGSRSVTRKVTEP